MKKFRVEAFIVPTSINNKLSNINNNNNEKLEKEVTGVNVIDDVKLANKLKEQSFDGNGYEKKLDSLESENQDDCFLKNMVAASINISKCSESDIDVSSEFSGEFFALDEHIYDEIVLPKTPLSRKIKIISTKSKQPIIVNNDYSEYSKAFLKIEEPIYDEPYVGNLSKNARNENVSYDVPQPVWALAQSKYRRYGIVAPKLPKRTSSLHSITEDIELGSLDETSLPLCCRDSPGGPERVSESVFKENWMQKLCALRNLETLLKDKEIALQSRERLLFKKEKELRILEKLIKDKMRQAELYARRCKKSKSSDSINQRSSRSSRSHEEPNNGITSNHQVTKSLRFSRESRSHRARSRHRKTVDDMDTTLSADVGDSPVVITTKKFDPVNLKKPLAFARSASERKAPQKQVIMTSSTSMTTATMTTTTAANYNNDAQPVDKNECANYVVDPVQEKIFKRFSENILACQDQETKFHSYGLIDESVITGKEEKPKDKEDVTNDKKFSYLNLETISKTLKLKNNVKDPRPTSWNEETDSWLKKKRQAYNAMASKSVVTTEKENNCAGNNTKSEKSTSKGSKNKDGKEKKFSIFR